MFFKIIGRISDVETIASGTRIRERRRLRKTYGGQNWRKLKGIAPVKLVDGTCEVHWYEAHGIGPKELKIKRIWKSNEANRAAIRRLCEEQGLCCLA